MIEDTKNKQSVAIEWQQEYGPQPELGLVKIAQLNQETFRKLFFEVCSIPDSIYVKNPGDSTRLGTIGVGLFLQNGDYTRWYEQFDDDGNPIDINRPTSEVQRSKSVRNIPNPKTSFLSTPFLQEFYSSFPGMKRCVINNLPSKKQLAPHTDSVENHRRRIHVCVTNQDVVYFIGGKAYQMTQGGVYWFNTFLTHGVKNDTLTDRKNLIIDCYYPGSLEDFVLETNTCLQSKNYLE